MPEPKKPDWSVASHARTQFDSLAENPKTYSINLLISMPQVVKREGMPDIPVNSSVVAASMERLLRDSGVDLISSVVEEVTPIDDEDDEVPTGH